MADSLDCTNALQPCACTANQICVQIGRSSTECARNTCVDRAQSGGSGGGKSNIGALAGQAVGGVIGGILILGALYWFWRRKRAGGGGAARTGGASNKGRSGNGSAPNSATSRKSPNPLKEFKMGTGGGKGEKDVTASPGPGEGDAQPVKRQSLRFDRNNNPLSNRRSLSNTHNALPDNPFGDHHGSSDGASTRSGATDTTETGAGLHGQRRESHATISEFSFRSSHSTNIIPIAYIPAHASQNGTVDQQRRHTMSVRDSTSTAGGMRRSTNPLGVRGSRASVPFSLHSSTTTNDAGLSMGDATFSGLFDRRMSAHTAGGESANGNGLEIIANANGAASPSLTTPTLTKNGRPIRPPRAPGLDLKLPTPELKSPTALSPPISPGYPWSSSKSGSTSPGALAAAGGLAPPGSAGISPRSQRETLMTADGANARASAYSTFSQATGSTGSHMSYLLDPPMIVTPVSAGRVEIQQIQRGVAKTVKLGSPNPGTLQGSPSVPAVPAQYLATSPALSRSNTLTLRSGSPNSDNPFEDANAEVRIAMPSGNSPILPNTPTFGGNASPFSDSNLPGARGSFASQASHTTRRDSDLSIFTSASGQLGATTSQQQAQADPRAATPSTTSARMSHSHSASVSITAEDEVILEPPMRPFAASGDFAPSGPGSDSRHNSAALSTRSGYASVLDGIPFNLSLSPEARHSQASSAGGSGAAGGHGSGVFLSQPHGQLGAGQRRTSNLRDSSASYASGSTADELHNGSDKRDTSYSLASEWNGAFAGMPIVMGGPTDAAVPELPAMYRQTQTQAQMDGSAQRSGDDENDPRYSSDSLAMAAAVARQFGTH